MDSENFMTFSVEDNVNCIEYFREGQMFVATPKSIKVYDLTQSTLISQCDHSIGKFSRERKESLNKKENIQSQLRENQVQKQDQMLTALQMHYFPVPDTQVSEIKQQDGQIGHSIPLLTSEWEENSQSSRKLLGYLLVHYKMTGLSTYKIEQSLESQNHKGFCFNRQQQSIVITFVSHLQVKFGSAFLNLTSLTGVYSQTNINLSKYVKEKYLVNNQNQAASQFIEAHLKSHMNLADFTLKQKCKLPQFMVFQNEDQMFQIKKIALTSQGLLQVKQSYQIDEQTAKLNSSTVTAMKYFEYQYESSTKNQSFLIMAIEPGQLCLYQLPYSQETSSNVEHYLEPIKRLDVKKHVEFQPKIQDLDYSVISIELIHQSLGLVLVRNCGILLLNLKDFSIINQVSIKNGTNKNYYFTDTRLIVSVRSDLIISTVKVENSSENQAKTSSIDLINKLTNSQLQITLILANKNSLKKLSLEFTIDKFLESLQVNTTKQFKVLQKVSITKTKCNTIEQLNTHLIHNMFVVKQPNQQLIDQEIEVFGNFQPDKIFYFTP